MGRLATQQGIAGALFSKVQLRILGLLFGHPSQTYHVSEIIKLAQSGSGAVQRELGKLTAAGIVTLERSGKRKVYQANRRAPIFKELRGIVVKTVGLLDPIRNALRPFEKHIHFAFIYGSVAKGLDKATSDVDVMIVGDGLTYSEVFVALQHAEKTIDRAINPNVMAPSEWKKRLSAGTSFTKKVLEQPKIFIFGKENDIEQS